MPPAENAYQHLVYAGGWLLAPRHARHPEGWQALDMGSYQLSVSPGWPVARTGPVTVLGRPVDPGQRAAGPAPAAAVLAAAETEGRFLDDLDRLAGRFIVFINDTDGPRIYQDAAGTRTVFYRPPVAASHSALAAASPSDLDDDVGAMWERILRQGKGVRYLPGIRAPHQGVRMLTPNTWLNVPDGTVARFWPRKRRVENQNLDLLTVKVAEIVSSTARVAAQNWPLTMSLTAGIDSRLTLAACREVADRIHYFSHINPDTPHRGHQIDLEIAREITEKFGLDHTVYPLGEAAKGETYSEFLSVWRQNMGIARGLPALMKGYVDRWPRDRLHLRSNVAEIGRVFYKGDRLDRITPAGLSRRWSTAMGEDSDCIAAFDEFCKVAGFTDEAMMGYDPLDLFYWEHRMGSWHAWLCMEADVAHDTFPIYSNRQLLEVMLAAPFHDRLDATLFHQAVALMWPELSRWPINPKRWPPAGDRS